MIKYYQAIIVVLLFCIPLISIAAQSPIAPGAQLVTEYSSNLFYEGPTWDPVTGTLYFTTPNNSPYSIYRLEGNGQASVWMQN